MVCPPAFSAATPVGARTIDCLSGNRARSSRMNVDFPVPAPPVTNTICFPRATASNAACNSRLISIGSGARFFANRRRGTGSSLDDDRQERGPSLKSVRERGGRARPFGERVGFSGAGSFSSFATLVASWCHSFRNSQSVPPSSRRR
jgi:hypothetical protein